MLITEIHTGRTPGPTRKATLMANESATTPHALAALTAFLQSRGLTATPGYNEGHVLRVRGFKTDEEFRKLLVEEFPAWMKTHPSNLPNEKLVADDVAFIPMDHDVHQPFNAKRFVQQYATPLVGGLSFLSGVAMLAVSYSHFRKQRDDLGVQLFTRPNPAPHMPTQLALEKTKAGINTSASLFFIGAAGLLAGLGTVAAHKASVTELLQSYEPELNRDPKNFVPPHRTMFQHSVDTALNNPWRLATALNFVGVVVKGVGHSIPNIQSSVNSLGITRWHGVDKDGLWGAAAGIASAGLIAAAAPERTPDLLGMQSYGKSEKAKDPLERQYQNYRRVLSPLDPANDQGRAGHINMKAAGYLSMLATAGFAARGIKSTIHGIRVGGEMAVRAKKEWPLMLLIPLNLTADYLTTLSKPRFSYSIDEVATESADYIARKLDMKTASPEAVTRQTYILSELLASQPRFTKSARELREAIAARLELDYGYHMPSADAGVKEYQHLYEISPFAAEKPLTTVEKTSMTQDRMQPPAITPAIAS